MNSKLLKEFHSLLEACTVRIDTGDRRYGTGFFVAPGRILTCAHVVSTRAGKPLENVTITFRDERSVPVTVPAEDYHPEPYPDLALLHLDLDKYPDFRSQPVAVFSEEAPLSGKLYSWGHGREWIMGEHSLTVDVEGQTYTKKPRLGPFMKLKLGHVSRGMSGAPLLDLATGKICGVLKASRSKSSDLGGWGIPAPEVYHWYASHLAKRGLEAAERWDSMTKQVERSIHRTAPPLLPYECDRDKQRTQLTRDLRQHRDTCPSRPLVCFVHGHHREGLDGFLSLASRSIFPAEAARLKPYRISWSDSGMPVHRRGEDVHGRLMDALLIDRGASPETLAADLASNPTPTLVFVDLTSRDWNRQEVQALLSWLGFWAEFPDLPADRGIFLFVGIRHETPNTLFQRWQTWVARRKITEFIEHVRRSDGSFPLNRELQEAIRTRRLSLAALEELESIPLGDARSWINTHAAEYCPEHVYMFGKVDQLYQGRTAVPMEDLVGLFIQWLGECSPSAAHT